MNAKKVLPLATFPTVLEGLCVTPKQLGVTEFEWRGGGCWQNVTHQGMKEDLCAHFYHPVVLEQFQKACEAVRISEGFTWEEEGILTHRTKMIDYAAFLNLEKALISLS